MEIHGTCKPGFEAVREAFEANFADGLELGAAAAVTVDGEFVVDIWAGDAGAEGTRWQRDTIVNVYSTTKTMAATCMLVLADRGELDFDAPVARYWPEFARNGKHGVLVRHVMAHTAGVPGFDPPITVEQLYDLDTVSANLAAQAPWWEPGTASGYHAITQGNLEGEILYRITGRRMADWFRTEVAEPLGADFWMSLPASEDHRVADLVPPVMGGKLEINGVEVPLDSIAVRALLSVGELHRWMQVIGHDGRSHTSIRPVEVHSMAQRLSSEERARIEAMRAAGVGVAETARRLGRDPSTIHRELKRGGCGGGYDAEAAQAAADARAARPKTPVLAADPGLAAAVAERLAMRWSPHAVCADLRAQGRTLCAETIYRACYDHSGSRGLPEGSWRLLPRRCRRRKPRGRCTRKPSPLGDFKPVADRPAAASDRREAGHWEGDLIIGKSNRSAVATLVERLSRQTLAVALPDGYDAPSTAAAVTAALGRQPKRLVKTLTWDQGTEMARWRDVEAALGIEVYFCEPRSPWQRPTNEQTNGMLRRWLPKSTDLNVGAVRLAIIEDQLNTMPRKLHGWDSAHSVYAELTCNHR